MFVRAEGVVVAERYRLVRKLGIGGMGAVWLAHDQLLDASCALKLIDDDKAESEEVRVRFMREAKVAAQLRGSHVVDVFDHGEFERVPYIAMEFLDGEDLGTRLERVGKLDYESTYRIVAHVARALVRAHSCGVVHRDLKPENVFLVQGDEGEIAKVLDFGIAKHDQYSLRDKTTKTGSFLGTPFYVSPEQARGKPTDHRSDLWSLAVIAFQSLTGRPPFESEALGELMGMILYDDIPVPSALNPDLPKELDEWWAKAAARDREQRFQSGKELADALGVALGVVQVFAVPSIAPRRVSPSDQDIVVPPADGRETDAPLSNTRHSADFGVPNFQSGIARHIRPIVRGVRMRLRSVPRRYLAAAAVASGIAAGTALTLALTSSDPPPVVAVPVEPVQEPASNGIQSPVPPSSPNEPRVEPTLAPAPSATPSASASASPSAAPEEDEAKKQSDPKSVRPLPVRKPVKSGTRDYGI